MPKIPVEYITISEDYADQRIDNYLVTRLKNVPKTHIYRILRKGEVRVNKKRVAPNYRLQTEDIVRLPPLEIENKQSFTSKKIIVIGIDLSGLDDVIPQGQYIRLNYKTEEQKEMATISEDDRVNVKKDNLFLSI